jgi:hypothetical protein
MQETCLTDRQAQSHGENTAQRSQRILAIKNSGLCVNSFCASVVKIPGNAGTTKSQSKYSTENTMNFED